MTARSMVSMEDVCLAFMLVILLAYIFLPRSEKLRRDWFFYSLVLTIFGLVFDLIAWASELGTAHVLVQYISNFLALIMTNFVISAFGYYVVAMINEKKQMPMAIASVNATVNFLAIVATAVGGIFGNLFDIHPSADVPGALVFDDGGFLYELPMAVATVSMAFLFILVLCNTKALGRRNVAIFSIYFLLPLVVGVLELIVENLLLSYVAISVSISIIYVLLQSTNMGELLLREKLLNEISYVDQLTGLLNRRACDRDVERIKEDESVSIVFCDLNGLKQINDMQGHRAGDQFLITFSKIITKHFPHDSVYRISGDEFVVVARNISRVDFERRIACLRDEIDANAGIAALGTICGDGRSIPALVKQAEISMYEDKKNFYRHNPGYRRGNTADTEPVN